MYDLDISNNVLKLWTVTIKIWFIYHRQFWEVTDMHWNIMNVLQIKIDTQVMNWWIRNVEKEFGVINGTCGVMAKNMKKFW